MAVIVVALNFPAGGGIAGRPGFELTFPPFTPAD